MREILDRLNEVSFNATLLKELRMIALLRQVADVGTGEGAQWAGMRIHRFSRGYIGLQAGEEARPFRWLLTYSAITESGAPPHDAAK